MMVDLMNHMLHVSLCALLPTTISKHMVHRRVDVGQSDIFESLLRSNPGS